MGTLVFVATHKKRIAITPALNISGCPVSAVALCDSLAKSLQSGKKREIWHKVSFGCKEQI